MALRAPRVAVVAAPVLVFLATFAALSVANGDGRGGGLGPSATEEGAVPATQSTTARIAALERTLRGGDTTAATWARLGEAHLQRTRETGDPSSYPRAEAAFRRALVREPRDLDATVGLGRLALARHDFRDALRQGEAARRRAPLAVGPFAVLVDARVELGRYREAAQALQQMVDLKPNLASYARASYLRELGGDLTGAREAMRLAVSAGGDAPENMAYVQTLLGDLELEGGRTHAGADAYRRALEGFPAHAPALAGLARVDAARGRLGPAIRRYRDVVARLPLPEYLIALGEAELAAGRRSEARETFALVKAEGQLLAAGGVDSDVELAVFEADHGDPRAAVRLAGRGWAAAPSVRSADARGWALTRAGRPRQGLVWSRRALRLGSRDPLFLYHAGIAARGAGRPTAARMLLARSLELNPRFSPLHASRARRSLAGLR